MFKLIGIIASFIVSVVSVLLGLMYNNIWHDFRIAGILMAISAVFLIVFGYCQSQRVEC